MQDQNTDLGSQPSVEEENIKNNDLRENEENIDSSSPEASAEGVADQEKSGELPEDFKGRLAREKRKNEKDTSLLRNQVNQLSQTVQALLNIHNAPPQSQDSSAISSEGDDEVSKKVQSELKKIIVKANEEKTAQEINSRVSKVYKDMDTAYEKYPDFDEIRSDPNLFFPKPLLDLVALSTKNPIDVIYRLGKNQDELNRIANLHPALQSGEIAQISAEILANAPAKGKEISKAPPPANALANNPAANSGRIKENATVDELRKLFR